MNFAEITALAARQYFEHRGTYRNPYAQGTQEYDAYERGWMQSLKKNDARLVSKSSTSRAWKSEPTLPPPTTIPKK